MANNETAMTSVPENKVGEVVQQYIDWDDATEVRCKKAGDGTWKVVAD